MTGPLSRLGTWLVEPAAVSERPAERPRRHAREDAPASGRLRGERASTAPPPAEIAVLAPPAEARALGAGLALRAGRGVAVLGVWTGAEPPARAAAPLALRAPAARRRASALAGRGLETSAAGRLVTVFLPPGEVESAAVVRRLLTADVPVVLAVGGPRAAAWDEVLRELDLVLVRAQPRDVQELAIGRLLEQGIVAAPLEAAPGPVARSFALAGLAFPGALPVPEAAR